LKQAASWKVGGAHMPRRQPGSSLLSDSNLNLVFNKPLCLLLLHCPGREPAPRDKNCASFEPFLVGFFWTQAGSTPQLSPGSALHYCGLAPTKHHACANIATPADARMALLTRARSRALSRASGWPCLRTHAAAASRSHVVTGRNTTGLWRPSRNATGLW